MGSNGTLIAELRDFPGMTLMDPEFSLLKEESDKNIAALWAKPLDEFRAQYKDSPPAVMEGLPVPGKDIEITHEHVLVRDGSRREIRVYKQISPYSTNAMLFLVAHGGGWVVGTHDIEESQNRLVAGTTNTVVVSVDYRMAPEYKFPYAVNDCYDTLLWCIKNSENLGINPEHIVLGGCSAGGNIAAVLAQMARNNGIEGIVGQVLNMPVICHPKHFPLGKYRYESYQGFTDTSVLDTAKMDWFWNQYLPGTELHERSSPLLAKSLQGLPPALIQIAGIDPLRDEGLAYAEAMEASSVSVTLKVFPGLPHAFNIYPKLRATKEYYYTIRDWIQELQTSL